MRSNGVRRNQHMGCSPPNIVTRVRKGSRLRARTANNLSHNRLDTLNIKITLACHNRDMGDTSRNLGTDSSSSSRRQRMAATRISLNLTRILTTSPPLPAKRLPSLPIRLSPAVRPTATLHIHAHSSAHTKQSWSSGTRRHGSRR